MTDAELLERTRTAEAGTHDWNFFNDEYDRRHRQEYADLTDHYRAILEQTQPTLDDAYAMLAAADQHFHYGGHARPERTELLAQRHTLQDYIDRKKQTRPQPSKAPPTTQSPWRLLKRKATQLSTSKNDWPN